MTIIFGTLNTGAHPHGTIKPSAYDAPRVVQKWFGVTGEMTLTGRMHGRDLSCWLLLTGYASHGLLHAGIVAVNDYINTSGTLDVNGLEFLNVIFHGFEPDEDPWYDGSGVNGWQVLGTMRFRQSRA